jgi:hypothetical protein
VAQKLEIVEAGQESSRPSTHSSAHRKEIHRLKQLLAEKTLEVDFFEGALQKIEAGRQRNNGSGGLQIEYSLMERTVERELILMAKALNSGVLAWSPLASGVLTGKYHDEGKADGGRMTNEGMEDFLPEEQRAAPILGLRTCCVRFDFTAELAWLRHQTVPVIPIIGARKVSQLQDNLASLDLELSAEQLKSLDGASRIELGFPHSMYEREMVRGVRYGDMWDRLLL